MKDFFAKNIGWITFLLCLTVIAPKAPHHPLFWMVGYTLLIVGFGVKSFLKMKIGKDEKFKARGDRKWRL